MPGPPWRQSSGVPPRSSPTIVYQTLPSATSMNPSVTGLLRDCCRDLPRQGSDLGSERDGRQLASASPPESPEDPEHRPCEREPNNAASRREGERNLTDEETLVEDVAVYDDAQHWNDTVGQPVELRPPESRVVHDVRHVNEDVEDEDEEDKDLTEVAICQGNSALPQRDREQCPGADHQRCHLGAPRRVKARVQFGEVVPDKPLPGNGVGDATG